jgi:ABC-type multidrug transport system permease subunit
LSGQIHTGGRTVRVRTPASVADLQALTCWAVGAGHGLDDLTVSPPTLEEAYLELTGEAGHDRDDHTRTSPSRARSRQWSALSGHAVTAFLRNPMAAFFTLVFPLTFLVIVAALVGDQRTETRAPVAQLLITPFAVFGVAQASFTMLAVDTAALRESGVLMWLRGTPVSASTVIAARITAAAVASLAAVLLLTAVGAAFYDVDIVWHKVPALVVTVVLGIACLAALGLALTSLTRTVLAAQTLAQGMLIPLAFISDVFIVGARLPDPLAVTGSLLPLKHFARAAAETFQPGPGSGFSPGHLAVLAVWTAVGTVIAVRWFGWSPRGTTGPPSSAGTTAPGPVAILSAPRATGPVGGPALLAGQVRYAMLGLRRDLRSPSRAGSTCRRAWRAPGPPAS